MGLIKFGTMAMFGVWLALAPALFENVPPPKHYEIPIVGLIQMHSLDSLTKIVHEAKRGDTITINIFNSPGGMVEPGFVLLEEMQRSKAAEIDVVVHGYAYSMAADIALEADHLVITFGSEIGVHYGNAGMQELNADDRNSSDRLTAQYVTLIYNYARSQYTFFKQSDFDLFDTGELVVITSSDWNSRTMGFYNGRLMANPYIRGVNEFIVREQR